MTLGQCDPSTNQYHPSLPHACTHQAQEQLVEVVLSLSALEPKLGDLGVLLRQPSLVLGLQLGAHVGQAGLEARLELLAAGRQQLLELVLRGAAEGA